MGYENETQILEKSGGWHVLQGGNPGCKPLRLFERVLDPNAVDFLCPLHVFRNKYAAPRLFGRTQNQSIPKRKPVKAMQVDRGENVGDFGSGHVELGEQFNFAAGNARVHTQFPRERHEIFLKHLQRHNSGSPAPVLRYQIEGPLLLRRIRLVIRVNQDVGIEEATSRHCLAGNESRHD